MEKDFDRWNEIKKGIDSKAYKVLYKENEIWWISIWQNIKTESYWKWKNFRRPILVIKKLSNENCIWIPLSSKSKTWTWFYEFDLHGIKRIALLYQVRMFNSARFQKKIWEIDNFNIKVIKKRLKQLLNL